MNLFTSLLLAVVLAAVGVVADTNQGTPCLSSCSKWSHSLNYCYDSFGLSPSIQGYDYSNQFVACLCEGRNMNGSWGNTTMIQATSICQSCSTTPREIKENLSTFLTLCTIQATNGTAANATTFAPLKYTTADDPRVGIVPNAPDGGGTPSGTMSRMSVSFAAAGLALVVTLALTVAIT